MWNATTTIILSNVRNVGFTEPIERWLALTLNMVPSCTWSLYEQTLESSTHVNHTLHTLLHEIHHKVLTIQVQVRM